MWSHGWNSCTQAWSNFKLAGVMLVCSYGSTALCLGYANLGRSWINNWKCSLHWTPCCLSYLSGCIHGSYFQACPDPSMLAALTGAALAGAHTHWELLEWRNMLWVSSILYLIFFFFLLVVTNNVTEETPQKTTGLALHPTVNSWPSAAEV